MKFKTILNQFEKLKEEEQDRLKDLIRSATFLECLRGSFDATKIVSLTTNILCTPTISYQIMVLKNDKLTRNQF